MNKWWIWLVIVLFDTLAYTNRDQHPMDLTNGEDAPQPIAYKAEGVPTFTLSDEGDTGWMASDSGWVYIAKNVHLTLREIADSDTAATTMVFGEIGDVLLYEDTEENVAMRWVK